MIKFVKKYMTILWKIWFLMYMIFSTLLFFPILYLSIIVFKNYELTFKIYRIWAWSICISIGIWPSISGVEKLPKNSNFIILSNHTSYLDIIVSYTRIHHHYAFLAKEELKKAPLFNINFKGMNVTVNRKSAISGKESMTECQEKLKQNINLLIFPEGTCSITAPSMRSFKNGAFKLAIETQTDLVPIAFLDNYKWLNNGKKTFENHGGPGKSRIVVLDPISTKNKTLNDLENLKSEVFSKIQTAVLNG